MIATTVNFSKNNTPFRKIGLFACSLVLLAGCARLPSYSEYPTQPIHTGPGPEDMVLDTFTRREAPRMFISCSERRKNKPGHGEIWVLDLSTDRSHVFPRKGDPEGLGFHPHGIDLVRRPDGSVRLYAINHRDSLNRQLIMEYLVLDDHLQFVAAHENPGMLTSPNDVCADPKGGFYWSNDASTRKNAFIEPVFGIRGGYVGHKSDSAGGRWEKSGTKFAYANGIGVLNGDLYISTVIQSHIFRFRNQDLSAKPEKVCKVVGGDNLTFLPDGRMLVTAHLRQLKFLSHMKRSENKSPSVVYLVNPLTGDKKAIYANDGHAISTASTAIWFNGYLYVCQVFDGFVLKLECALPQ